MISKHNIKDGFINCCQICGSKKIKNVLELGYQPLADDLKNFGSNNQGTNFYPISIGFCKKCILLQNNYIVDDKILYTKNYHYRPGITKDVVNNFKEMSLKLFKREDEFVEEYVKTPAMSSKEKIKDIEIMIEYFIENGERYEDCALLVKIKDKIKKHYKTKIKKYE